MNEHASIQKENENKYNAQSYDVLIDKKISDAKLSIYDRQIKFLLSFGAIAITVFGIVIPIWQSINTGNRIEDAIKGGESKIDQEIATMELKFSELSGKLSQKPEISCFVDGSDLANNVVHFNAREGTQGTLVQKVRDVSLRVCDTWLLCHNKQDWMPREPCITLWAGE